MWFLLPNQQRNKGSTRSSSSSTNNTTTTSNKFHRPGGIAPGYVLLLLPLAITCYSLIQSFLMAQNARFTQVIVSHSSDDASSAAYSADFATPPYYNNINYDYNIQNDPNREYSRKKDVNKSLSGGSTRTSKTTMYTNQDSVSLSTKSSSKRNQNREENDALISSNSNNNQKKGIDIDAVVEKPEIVWLASYPNSGTSYTMTLVERGSNLSTASNYGPEVTPPKGSRSIPVHGNNTYGPYWEGHHNAKLMGHTIRDLPDHYILTKTHCGGRCIKCPATEYVTDVDDYIKACQRSTFVDETGHATEYLIPREKIVKLIHLIRNPIDNTVSRFHLERRHFIEKDPKKYNVRYPLNFTGFQQWCDDLDNEYSYAEKMVISSSTVRHLMEQVPCRAEFYKFAQWHNMLLQTVPQLGPIQQQGTTSPIPVLTLYYENYHAKFNETATEIFEFLNQSIVKELREFRSLPDYSDHYTAKQLHAIHDLVKRVATDETWNLVHHYFETTGSHDKILPQRQPTKDHDTTDIDRRQLEQLNDVMENNGNSDTTATSNNNGEKEKEESKQLDENENDAIMNQRQPQQPRKLKSLSSIHQQLHLHKSTT